MKVAFVLVLAFLAVALAIRHDGRMKPVKAVPSWVDVDAPQAKAPMGDCTIEMGLQCASVIAGCAEQCTSFSTQCLDCVGSAASTCCPCLQAAFPNFPC